MATQHASSPEIATLCPLPVSIKKIARQLLFGAIHNIMRKRTKMRRKTTRMRKKMKSRKTRRTRARTRRRKMKSVVMVGSP